MPLEGHPATFRRFRLPRLHGSIQEELVVQDRDSGTCEVIAMKPSSELECRPSEQ